MWLFILPQNGLEVARIVFCVSICPTLPRPVDFPPCPVPLAPLCLDGVQIHNALAAIIKRIFRNYQTYLSKLSAFDATPTVRN